MKKDDKDTLLETFEVVIDNARTNVVNNTAGFDAWQVGYVTGLEKALKLLHECIQKNKEV